MFPLLPVLIYFENGIGLKCMTERNPRRFTNLNSCIFKIGDYQNQEKLHRYATVNNVTQTSQKIESQDPQR